MEKELQEFLRPGEQVRWQGQPGTFGLLEAGCKKQILFKWFLTALLTGALLVAYFVYNEAADMKFPALVLLVAAVILVSPLTEQRSLQKVRYWITDQRVIMMNKEKTCYGMELADIDTWKRVRGMSDRDCLVLGSSIFDEVKRQLRWRAVHPKTAGQDQAGRVEGMILYGPEDADGASAILQNVAHESGK